MSRRFRRPPVMDTTSIIDGYGIVIENGYAMLNSIPEECSVDRSLLGTMLSKYKRAREGLADLLDHKVGPALNGTPVTIRESRIDWDSDTVASDGQRVANHHLSDSAVEEMSSNTQKETTTMSCKVVRTGTQLNSVSSSAHESADKHVATPLVSEVAFKGVESVTFKASGQGWLVEDGSKRRSYDFGALWIECWHYDWTPDTHSATVSSAALLSQLKAPHNVSSAMVYIGADNLAVAKKEDAFFMIKFGKRTIKPVK